MKVSTVISIIFAIVLMVVGIVGLMNMYINAILLAFNRSQFDGWSNTLFPLLILIGWCLLSALDKSNSK